MKNCIMLWKNDAVDLAINNQRRAFLSSLETEDLKNTPCILVINQTGQQATACLFHTSNKPLLPE